MQQEGVNKGKKKKKKNQTQLFSQNHRIFWMADKPHQEIKEGEQEERGGRTNG